MPRLWQSVVIERATSGAVDDYGQPSRTFATLATVPGLVQQKSADELVQANQAGPVASEHKVYLYLGVDIAEADRIVQGGRTFEVTGVDPDVGGAQHHVVAELQLVEASA